MPDTIKTKAQLITANPDYLSPSEISAQSIRDTIVTALNGGAAATVADGGTIAHGCGYTPTIISATGSVAGEIVSVTGVDGTSLTIAIKTHAGAAGTTQTIFWTAK